MAFVLDLEIHHNHTEQDDREFFITVPRETIVWGSVCISGTDIDSLMQQTYISVPDTMPHLIAKPLLSMSHSEVESLCICGPVYITSDGSNRGLQSPNHIPVFVISQPDLDFNNSDVREMCTLFDSLLSPDMVLDRMSYIWRHILAQMHYHRVQWPCLCPMSYGHLQAEFGLEIPSFWAEALCNVLATNQFPLFTCIFISLPTILENHYSVYVQAFRKRQNEIGCPVIIKGQC